MKKEGKGNVIDIPHFPRPLPSPSFYLSLTHLEKNLFSPQPSAAMKIKDGSYDFYRENTEYLRAKITQASRKMFKVPCEARTKTIIRWLTSKFMMIRQLMTRNDKYNAHVTGGTSLSL